MLLGRHLDEILQKLVVNNISNLDQVSSSYQGIFFFENRGGDNLVTCKIMELKN
jgi:hypothetical protein